MATAPTTTGDHDHDYVADDLDVDNNGSVDKVDTKGHADFAWDPTAIDEENDLVQERRPSAGSISSSTAGLICQGRRGAS